QLWIRSCPKQNDSFKEDTMNVNSPPTLMKLASQRLLREEALAISALKELPNMLFPMMFEEAFINGHTKILKAMIPLWPFPYFFLGMMIKNLTLDTLKDVLQGIDILISKVVHSSRCKLKEIKWKNTDYGLQGIWPGSHEVDGLSEFMEQKQPDCRVKKELKVITHLKLMEGSLDECATYLLHWAQQRKDSIHLCCRKLKIQGLINATVIEIFKIVHADCIQELELCCLCLEDLEFLNPYLKQINNLIILKLDEIKGTVSMGESRNIDEEKVITLISQLPTLQHLEKLCINDVPFIEGNLKECLRCLKKPLEILCITNCYLLQSDLDYLPYCLNILELKCLDLSNIPLSHLLLEHLRFLFERVRHTLECLILKSCEMGESQFNSLLPAISQCCQLTELSQLTYELYPAPLECCDNRDIILSHRLEKFCPELLNILRAKRQPKDVTFATTQCYNCGGSYVYNLETQHCFFEKYFLLD
uniref:Uncharacterized protein n=1 Tax=Mus spicilegus TaxID=10103 RepID=A0A8C6HDM1_MUSSI